MELLEIIKFLRDNAYIVATKGRYAFSKKFYAEKEKLDGASNTGNVDVSNTWTSRYLQFIKDAGVPAKIEMKRGEYYVGNAYTENSMKLFQHIMTSGEVDVQYDLLVKSTKLYYRSGAKFKKKISNYLLEGDWQGDYYNLVQAMRTGQEETYTKTVEEHGPIDNWTY